MTEKHSVGCWPCQLHLEPVHCFGFYLIALGLLPSSRWPDCSSKYIRWRAFSGLLLGDAMFASLLYYEAAPYRFIDYWQLNISADQKSKLLSCAMEVLDFAYQATTVVTRY